MTGGRAGPVGERISIDAGSPLHRDEARFTRQVVNRLIRDSRVQLPDHDRDHHYRNDHKRLKKQPLRELHERSVTFLIR